MLLLTGASQNHSKSLVALLESVKKHEPTLSVRVYDLGLGKDRDIVEQVGYPIAVFPYDRYPDYVDITKNAGEYAWKPIIISTVLEQEKTDILWLDGGCLLKEPLKRPREEIASTGIWSPISQGDIEYWTYPSVLHEMAVTSKVRRMHNRSGCIVGVSYKSLEARRIIHQWGQKSRIPKFICPKGSSRKNHRQDQSVLSILMAQSVSRGHPESNRTNCGILIHQDCD